MIKFNVAVPPKTPLSQRSNPKPAKNKPNGIGAVMIVAVENGSKPESFLLKFGDFKTGEDAFQKLEAAANMAM
jgi:hypothetical protein